jgi:hypothetical protein
MHEGAAEVFFLAESAQSLAGAGPDFAGVGSEEVGGYGDGVTVDDGEVEHEVVAFEAPAPGVGGIGVAEYGDVVGLGIADRAATLFHFPEDGFEAHDGGGLEESSLTQCRTEEADGEVALFRGHLAEREAFAVAGDEVPVETFGIIEFEGGLSLLLWGEGGEEAVGGFLHIGMVLVCLQERGSEGEKGDEEGEVSESNQRHLGI